VLGAAPPAVAALLKQFIEGPFREVLELRRDIRAYVEKLETISKKTEFLDLVLARRVATQCESLLDGLGPDSSKEHRQLIQAAVQYFIENEDEENDIESPIGFDDDLEVVELIAREIDRADILDIETPEDK